MSLQKIIEVAIGLVVIYYLLGVIVSYFAQLFLESSQARAAALETYLHRIAGDKTIDLVNLPQMRALQPIRYGHWWNVFGARTIAKKLERVPVNTLVDAFFDLNGLTSKGALAAAEMQDLISQLPDSEGKRALLGWINQGVTAMSDLRARTEDYFSGLLDQAGMSFKARARSLVILFSLLITVLIGADSIQLAQELWSNAELRSTAQQQAQTQVAAPSVTDGVDGALASLSAMSLRIGWWKNTSFPTTDQPLPLALFILGKIAGLGLTTAAVAQGSSFWYDLLKKLLRSGGSTSSSSTAPASPEAAG